MSGKRREKQRPMAGVALALADVLERLEWDGARDIIAGLVRTETGSPLGRIEIHVVPNTVLVVEGKVARVSPGDFIAALRHSWAGAVQPLLRQQADVVELHTPPSAPTEDGGPTRDEWRERYRTPMPWEGKDA